MRRPHVYERSVPRRRRGDGVAPGGDPGEAARGVSRALPALMAIAESAGLSALADRLEAARTEAERVQADLMVAAPAGGEPAGA